MFNLYVLRIFEDYRLKKFFYYIVVLWFIETGIPDVMTRTFFEVFPSWIKRTVQDLGLLRKKMSYPIFG